MNVDGKPYRTIWPHPDQEGAVQIIDQRHLPHRFVVEDIRSVDEMAAAIRDMHVRGAPLIGAAAAWGLVLAAHAVGPDPAGEWRDRLRRAGERLKGTRPTAVNLAWAVDRMLATAKACRSAGEAAQCLREEARRICDEDVAACASIGRHGLQLIQEIATRKDGAPTFVGGRSRSASAHSFGWMSWCPAMGTAWIRA